MTSCLSDRSSDNKFGCDLLRRDNSLYNNEWYEIASTE